MKVREKISKLVKIDKAISLVSMSHFACMCMKIDLQSR